MSCKSLGPVGKKEQGYRNPALAGLLTAFCISVFILYYPPMPGVADQGDFQRVMSVAGLERVENSADHWFKFVTTQYAMIPVDFMRILGIKPTTSIIYPAAAARILCRVLYNPYFDTRVLAFVYMLIYLAGFCLCIRWYGLAHSGIGILCIFISIFILFDGNYLVWFNSLYGEPMIISSLLLFIGSVLYGIHHIDERSIKSVFLVIPASFLFLGAKMQCFAAFPVILYIIIRIFFIKKSYSPRLVRLYVTPAAVILLLFYVRGIYLDVNNTCGIDTEYNSVFYGILKNTDTPKEDLKALGLPEDMALEAGKHAYLPAEQYIKYVPWSELTKTEFNDRINNFKLLKFYLLHPERLLKGMEYTASKSLDTGGSLGKFTGAEGGYIPGIHRFTLWSDYVRALVPHNLYIFIFIYLCIVSVSLVLYARNKGNIQNRLRIELFWSVIIIGLLQYPLPYLGNGEADTAKQLFLFNYTFDLTLLTSMIWVMQKLYWRRKTFRQ